VAHNATTLSPIAAETAIDPTEGHVLTVAPHRRVCPSARARRERRGRRQVRHRRYAAGGLGSTKPASKVGLAVLYPRRISGDIEPYSAAICPRNDHNRTPVRGLGSIEKSGQCTLLVGSWRREW
jgi:hypothetical protein